MLLFNELVGWVPALSWGCSLGVFSPPYSKGTSRFNHCADEVLGGISGTPLPESPLPSITLGEGREEKQRTHTHIQRNSCLNANGAVSALLRRPPALSRYCLHYQPTAGWALSSFRLLSSVFLFIKPCHLAYYYSPSHIRVLSCTKTRTSKQPSLVTARNGLSR